MTRISWIAVYASHFPIHRAIINETRLNISYIKKALYRLHLKLAHNIPDFLSNDSKSWNHAKNLSHRHSVSLNDKFSRLFYIAEIYLSYWLPCKSKCCCQAFQYHSFWNAMLRLILNPNFTISNQLSSPQLIAPIKKAFKNSRLTDTNDMNNCQLFRSKVSDFYTNLPFFNIFIPTLKKILW